MISRQIHELKQSQVKLFSSLASKELAEQEDKAIFSGSAPVMRWVKENKPSRFEFLKLDIYIFILEKTKKIRWWLVNKIAPDIHEDCYYDEDYYYD